MMTYLELLRNFRNEIELAIHGYEALFANAGTDVPTHRGHSISALRRIIRPERQNNEDLLFKVNGVYGEVEKFKTGLYIEFLKDSLCETGRSRLKKPLDAIINKPDYSKEAFLRAYIRDLEELLAAVDGVEPETVLELHQGLKLKQALDNANVQIQVLQGDKTVLETQNQQLQERNEALNKTITRMVSPQQHNALVQQNKLLQAKLENLRSDNKSLWDRIGDGQGMEIARPVNLATSPGQDICGSFGTFGLHN